MYIVADIGGTKMRVARADALDRLGETITLPTPPKYEQGIKVLTQTILQLQRSPHDAIKACVIGIAGSLNRDHSELFNSPNLPQWQHKPLLRRLQNELHTHIHIENDSALAALGEAHFGAGKGSSIVAYITVSTGTGGARIVNGTIDENSVGFEPGRQIIQADAEFKSLGRYISGAELQRTYGKRPQDITSAQVWENVARYTAYGLYNTIMFWSPHVIVVGGGLILHKAIQLDTVKRFLDERLMHTGIDIFPFIPEVRQAELGDTGGLHGGLAYIKSRRHHFEL